MDDLVINSKFTSSVVDDQDTDTATTICERVIEAGPQVALVENWQALFDVARLCHGHDFAILTHIKNAVLLEDRTKHVLDHNGRRWSRHEA